MNILVFVLYKDELREREVGKSNRVKRAGCMSRGRSDRVKRK